MACDKPYGLRSVWVRHLLGTWQPVNAQNIEVPKVFTEVQTIDEASGLREETARVTGNINDLTGTLTCYLPASVSKVAYNKWDTLFSAAGFYLHNSSYWAPQNVGACGNIIQMATIDRTGHLCEFMDGVIVTSMDFTFNRTDPPTVSFAYQAASKVELWAAPLEATLAIGSTEIPMKWSDGIRQPYSFNGNGPMIKIGTEVIQVAGVDFDASDNPIIELEDATTEQHLAGTDISFDVFNNNTDLDTISSNRAWAWGGLGALKNYKITSTSVTIETGMSYGELIVGQNFLSEVLVGTLTVTGSLTVYVDYTVGALAIDGEGLINDIITINENLILSFGQIVLTESPDLSLAKNAPATGDITWQAYSAGSDSVRIYE